MNKYFATTLILAGSVCLATGADVPFIFQPNTPAKSSEVNADFADVNAKAIAAQTTATAAQTTATTAQTTATAAATDAQAAQTTATAAQTSVNTLQTTVTTINTRVGTLEVATPISVTEIFSPTAIALTYTRQILAPGSLVTIGGKQYKMACYPVVNPQNMNKFKIYIPVATPENNITIFTESCSRTAKAAPIVIDGHDADYKIENSPYIRFADQTFTTASVSYFPKIQVIIMLNSNTVANIYCSGISSFSVTIPVDANSDCASGANFTAINAAFAGIIGSIQSNCNQFIGLIRVETVP